RQFFHALPCPDRVGSISCVRRSWPWCICTTLWSRRPELKSYGDRYITSWYHPTKPTWLANPTQAKAEYAYLFCHVALQRDMRNVLLLGRAEPEGRSLVG